MKWFACVAVSALTVSVLIGCSVFGEVYEDRPSPWTPPGYEPIDGTNSNPDSTVNEREGTLADLQSGFDSALALRELQESELVAMIAAKDVAAPGVSIIGTETEPAVSITETDPVPIIGDALPPLGLSSTTDEGTGTTARRRSSRTAKQLVNPTIPVVPEPGTIALLASGGISLLWWYRRQRRNRQVSRCAERPPSR